MREFFRLLRYVRRYSAHFVEALVLMAISAALAARVALLLGPVLDKFHNPASIIALAIVSFFMITAASEYLGTYLVNYVGYGAITDLRNALFEKLTRQSAAFYQRHATGRLMSTVVNDIERIQTAASASLADAVQQFFTFLFFAAVLLLLNWKLTLYAVML